jgi:hypothetical protein
MQGDFSRNTFDPLKQFRRVLMQQGRVSLDADFNEQGAILLHLLETLASDLIGWHGGPANSFQINAAATHDFAILPGHYYVEGKLCDNSRANLSYVTQDHYPLDLQETLDELADPGQKLLVYLDVWERHISWIEDRPVSPITPSIREVALGGPDTASRAQLIWQVKAVPIGPGGAIDAADLRGMDRTLFLEKLAGLLKDANYPGRQRVRPGTGKLRAHSYAGSPPNPNEPCIIPPGARYRGDDNRLYRVEVQRGGIPWDGADVSRKSAATFKWSRENGSVTFPLRAAVGGPVLQLEHLGRDAQTSLQKEDLVELVDDALVLRNEPGQLYRVTAIDLEQRTVTLDPNPSGEAGKALARHPLLRRWDQRPNKTLPTEAELADDNGLLLVAGMGEQGWLTLEDGIQVQFEPGAAYISGDYWLIPARAATGNIEWPQEGSGPKPCLPHGTNHVYAPLSVITIKPDNTIDSVDCRRVFMQFWKS